MKKIIIFLYSFCFINGVVGSEVPKYQSPEGYAPVALIELNQESELKTVTETCMRAAFDKDIYAIVLLIHSYGGNVDLFSMLHDHLHKIKKIKPVVSFIYGSALSGGYLVASATNYIVASSGSNLGSIGAMITVSRYKKPRIKEDAIEADLDIEVFSAGEFKSSNYPYAEKLTARQQKRMQKDVDVAYRVVIKLIAQNRNLNIDRFKLWAEGKLFIGEQAVKMGLVDKIGTMFEVADVLREWVQKQYPDAGFTNVDFIKYK